MRAGLLLLLISAIARAGEPSDRVRIEELVARLGSPAHMERLDARMRLIELGESIHPLLDELARQTLNPEIARTLREITRSSRTLRLVVLDAPERLVLGSDLEVEVALENRSKLSYLISLGDPEAGQHAEFHLRAGDQPSGVPMRWTGRIRSTLTIEPGESSALSLRVAGKDLPGLGPGRPRLKVSLSIDALKAPPGSGEMRGWSPTKLRLETNPFVVTWIARPVAEIERLLAEGTDEERESAVRELYVREGKEILGVLRRHAKDPDLRLAAIRRLGAAGLRRDLELVLKAVDDPEIRVKLAAVEALGNFRDRSARRQLLLHLDDHGLRGTAIRALTKHKHHETVNRFIRLWKTNMGGAWVPIVQKTLEEWTGIYVENRYSEVQAFERWWLKNRSRWIQEEVIGR